MNDSLKLSGRPIITGPPSAPARIQPRQGGIPQGQSFQDILGQTIAQTAQKPLSLSKHAQQRVQQRDIPLDDKDLERLEDAVDKARDKGITDTLVFMNNTAFIVNVPNKVVVTVVDPQDSDETVFTNINGAVIV